MTAKSTSIACAPVAPATAKALTSATTSATSAADRIDPPLHAAMARLTSSLSMASALLASVDWSIHLLASPGKCMDLERLAVNQAQDLARMWRDSLSHGPLGTAPGVDAGATDRRFAAPEWRQWPFNLMAQSFLMTEQWWQAATHGVWGVEKHHEDLVAFSARQILDMLSPGNQLLTNPVVLQRTLEQGGANLVRGALNALDEMERLSTQAAPAGAENFVVGRDVGITPGKVVLKNRLIELIQYTPTTDTVFPEPILIVPAWIMKYYILDLSAHNSLIKYLVDQGHTVFCISWKNPDAQDRDLGMDDYLELGFHTALAAVNAIVPQRPVHAVGYCLGGTLLAIAAAAMARDDDQRSDPRLATMTMFAAQTDFTEPGELGLFIDASQIGLLDAKMEETGYLTAAQMAGAFQMLRSYDLLWSRLVGEYLMGERTPMNDLMAWNADATRLPARMHSQYLHRLFQHNDLSEGRYPVHGKPVALSDITLPIFAVGTVTDHVAPWRSVYKLHHETVGAITFVLTSGGHNAGIVSPPGHPHRHYRILTTPAGGGYMAPDEWLARAPDLEGSWWPAWHDWLKARSGAPVAPPRIGLPDHRPVGDAPGTYVLEK